MTSRQKTIFWIVFITAVIAFLISVHNILLPFVVGLLMAYFLDPAADKLEDMGFSRTLATGVITLTFLGVIIILLVVIVPPAYNQLVQLADVLPGYIKELKKNYLPMVSPLLEQYGIPDPAAAQPNGQPASGNSTLLSMGGQVVKKILESGMAILNLVSLIVISPIVSFYMLRDWDKIVAKLDNYLPRAHQPTIEYLMNQIDITLSGFVRGYTNVILFLATFYSVGLSLLGLNYGLVIGILTGILTFIPYFGVTIGMATGLTVAYFQFQGDAQPMLMVLGVFVIGQFIEGNFITPKLVGEKVGLHPVWIIFALLTGGVLLGFTGVILGIPIAASLGVLIRFGLKKYTESSLYSNGTPHKIEGLKPSIKKRKKPVKVKATAKA